MEMDEWWKRHSDTNIEMTDDEKSDFEDITGRIPLLLEQCMVNGEIDLTADYLREIYDKAAGFARRVRDGKIKTLSRWQWYIRLIQTLRTLLTYQVLQVRSGLHPSRECTKWI
jgi:hypothetical protein